MAAAPKPHVAHCEACGDLGTVLLAGAKREARTMLGILRFEAPCVCGTGDTWRQIFEEWKRPARLKGATRPAAVVLDEPYRRPEPIPGPQSVKAGAQLMLASIGGRK